MNGNRILVHVKYNRLRKSSVTVVEHILNRGHSNVLKEIVRLKNAVYKLGKLDAFESLNGKNGNIESDLSA